MSEMAQVESILELKHEADPSVDRLVFHGDDECGGAQHCLILGREAWEDMGKPKVITVATRPGDRLNL